MCNPQRCGDRTIKPNIAASTHHVVHDGGMAPERAEEHMPVAGLQQRTEVMAGSS
jgi:hypothetical protein